MNYEKILKLEPFGITQAEKESLFLGELTKLIEFHRKNCEKYNKILQTFGYESAQSVSDLPFLPARIFKESELISVPKEEIFKTMTSSGTTGQKVSKIFLDRDTAANQQKTLTRIVSNFTGKNRLPMIIIDSPSVIKNRAMFSARGAGILGFSIFARKKIFALDENMNLNFSVLKEFISEHKNEKIILFGFTFMIWQYFYKALKSIGENLFMKDAILIHGGGWKKLANEKVSSMEFKAALKDVCGNIAVSDYYGMVEQTGCIYMECEKGHLHASTYSDIIIRKPHDFSVCNIGENGIIQVISLLPKSYPGNLILTEDEGELLGIDNCPCGRKGKYFRVNGRIKNAEIRGCSDTFNR
ncbi:MAG: acyl-protein synthetase [Selenomonadaceae bacterium]|nr:acyl-protein synthetase [Selenomonadaceae bacterium]MBR3721823.1 acyl-protein synthetase [Selenomonadaceae bacterium]